MLNRLLINFLLGNDPTIELLQIGQSYSVNIFCICYCFALQIAILAHQRVAIG